MLQKKLTFSQLFIRGILFGFVKSTEGATLISPTFARNRAGMKGAGFNAVLTTFLDLKAFKVK